MLRLLLPALLALAFIACEKKPSEEEVAAAAEKKAVEIQKAKASPTPKPGDWRIKDYKNPLDPKKGKK